MLVSILVIVFVLKRLFVCFILRTNKQYKNIDKESLVSIIEIGKN